MRAHGLVLAALCLSSVGCGSGDAHKRAVECQVDDDCDASTLGECDNVSCNGGLCELGHEPDGHRCDDSDPLTGKDACVSGICAGVAVTCDDALDPCLKAVHDPVTDECTVEPADDDTPCDDSDACTAVDTCQAGACVGSNAKKCKALDDCHVAGKCDPDTGECSDVKADDGAPCDDAQACTTDDTCQDGACAGTPVACDDGLACSVDACDDKTGACAADMTACACVTDKDCDDGDACNGAETCGKADKLCKVGIAVACPSSADPCQSNVCVPETGACQAEPVKDGAPCDDADACTTTDSCQSGVCVGADAVTCAALSQCHAAGVCDKVTGACTNPEKPAQSPCNDGDACTVTDVCQAGQCVGGGRVSCTPSDQCHDAGVCDTATGICSKPAKQNGVKCNDANPCTNGDACQSGVCTPQSQVVCTAADSCHTAGTCNTQTGSCSNPAKADGTVCSDGLTCTGPDTCAAGKCAGAAVKCDDGVACTVDSCSEKLGGCSVNSTGCACQTSADCDDGNACNGSETCNPQTLQCQAGKAVDCSSLGDACNAGSCSPATGLCVASPKADGTACDDGDLCTKASSCSSGVCQGSSPVTCVASDQCHDAGTCNSGTGLCSNPVKSNGAACNDGNACTKTDSCQGGTCTGSSAVVCAASDQCHNAGTCDTSSGVCSNPAKTNGSACDDGSLCTQTDTCQGGVCSGASPVTCTASDQCHSAGTCNPKTGGCSNPAKADKSACDDGNACTQTDTCQAGVCSGASPVTCVASDQCHVAGTCAPATGVCSNPTQKDNTACNDGSACTSGEKCLAGVCGGGTAVTCSASDQCHNAGTCDPATGTCSNPSKADGTLCNDGKVCTSADKCSKGVCGGTGVTCDDKIACTVDSCVEPTGCNFDQSKCGCTSDVKCNDGDPCNGVETCDLTTLTCKNGTAIDCSAQSNACNTGTCDSKTGTCKATPLPDKTACDDGDACTKTDGCVAGKCVGASPVTCSASDQCHGVGSCDSKTGACSNPSKPNGSSCDDAQKCTNSDVCTAGVCAGMAVTCTASDQCHSAGSCDSSTGVCTNPVKTGPCDDGNKCTQTDSCSNGACLGSNPVVCGTSDQCHGPGTCDAKTGGCSNPILPNNTACDDGNKCTQTDLCQAGVCTGTLPKSCPTPALCYTGVCDPQSGSCSTPFAASGTKCDDSDACTTGEVCDGAGACNGGSGVVCQQPSNTCLLASCNPTLGCQTSQQPVGTSCNDGSACTLGDICDANAGCSGTARLNANGDWADDPGSLADSVDIFSDGKNNAHVVGTYTAAIKFNDKDTKVFSTLALPAAYATGIYWAVYSQAGAIVKLANIGGVGKDASGAPGSITVVDAASYKDGSFTLVGMFNGPASFGPVAAPLQLTVSTATVYVAHYLANGSISWVAPLLSDAKATYAVSAVAVYDDGSAIAAGTLSNGSTFVDGLGKSFASDDRSGVWAARLGVDGSGQWASVVVLPIVGTKPASAALIANATTHEDGSASLSGRFIGSVGLGPKSDLTVSTSNVAGDVDVWYEKLDKAGGFTWGGRVGGAGNDLAGDVARIPGGGALLMVNTLGQAVNGSDAKTTQQFHATATSGYQTHIIGLDTDGVMQTDALIANAESGATRGFPLKRDLNGFYAAAGVFAGSTNFYSSVGFGSGAPKTSPDFTRSSQGQGPWTLFFARVDAASKFAWGWAAGGDGSGMITAPWDIVMAAHPSHAITLAGMFNANAIFGDQNNQKTELLTVVTAVGAAAATPNPFVVHLNSQEEYDYCP